MKIKENSKNDLIFQIKNKKFILMQHVTFFITSLDSEALPSEASNVPLILLLLLIKIILGYKNIEKKRLINVLAIGKKYIP